MKLKFEKNAKGPINIDECAPNGLYVVLGNNGHKEESLSGWKIVRIIDGSERESVVLDSGFSIRAGGKVKLHSGTTSGKGTNDPRVNIATWGVGANITTKLVNPAGEDRATHVQKTIYTS